jgi:exodeoxyribonuclease V alpha subunit
MKQQPLTFFRCQEFQPLGHHFAKLMVELSFPDGNSQDAAAQEALYLAGGLICHEAAGGNVCLDLKDYAAGTIKGTSGAEEVFYTCPALKEWMQQLRSTTVVGQPGETAPLILEETEHTVRLYLYRYWRYEQSLANSIRSRLQSMQINESLLQNGLERLFPQIAEEIDSQKMAVATALRNKFCVITGGPGTGKTTIVLKFLSLLIEQASGRKLRLGLAAPTGKAAAMLKASIINGRQELLRKGLISKEIADQMPDEASTLHRLLGTAGNSVYYRHNREVPLNLDCLIVDEASMIDLAMMCKLLDAISHDTRLVLLGDKDQLSSVEAGSVFGDICAGRHLPDSPLGRNIVRLWKSYRFEPLKGIGRLSNLINAGLADEVWDLLEFSKDRQVEWFDLPEREKLRQEIRERLLPPYRDYFGATDITEAFARLKNFSILCCLRQGYYGAENINRLIEEILVDEKLISSRESWYRARPVMITRNDYELQLFNGDIGIFMTDPEDGRGKVFFETMDPKRFRRIMPGRLPAHENAFASTVHKSQGSEFNDILLLLPDRDYEVLTRELFYTGITRARHHAAIWGSREMFLQAIHRQYKRSSGLRKRLIESSQHLNGFSAAEVKGGG